MAIRKKADPVVTTEEIQQRVAPGMRVAAAWSWRVLLVAALVAAILFLIVQLRFVVIPVGAATEQTLVCVVRRRGGYTEYPLIACRFVKLVGEQGWR